MSVREEEEGRDGAVAAAGSDRAGSLPPEEPSGIRLREVRLAGFGLYEQPTTFRIPDGPAVLVGGNEAGKSTFLHGIAAVWFGLPNSADPAEFGSARFRSHCRPKEFWGEVAWERNGRRFRLRRAFDSHVVRWVEETARGPERLYDGEHNPRGRVAGKSGFALALRERLGIADRELFLETFCVGQPLAGPTGVSAELQHALSGSRSGRVDDVLNRLFGEVKTLTRGTGDLGLVKPGKDRPMNQKQDGAIEQAEQELREAREGFDDGRQLLEELNEGNDELEDLQRRLEELKSAEIQARERLDGLERWKKLADERHRRERAARSAEGILRQLDDLERQRREEATPELRARFEPFRAAPEDLAARIDAAIQGAVEEETVVQATAKEEAAAREVALRAAALRDRLEAEFADVRGRADLPALREQLARAVSRREERTRAIAESLARQDGLRERLASAPDAGRDGADAPDPVALRPRVEAFLDGLDRIARIEERLAEIDGELEGRRFLEAEDRLSALRRKIELEEQLRGIGPRRRELELLRAGEEAAAEAQRAREEAAALAERATAGRGAGLGPWLAAAAGAGAAVAAAVRFGLGQSWAVALISAVVVCGLVVLGSRLIAGRSRSGSRGARPEEPPAPRPVAPPGATPAAPVPSAAPQQDTAAALAALRDEQSRLEAEHAGLREMAGPFAGTTASELAVLEERWERLAEELRRQEEAAAGLDARLFPAAPPRPPAAGSGRPDWRGRPLAALAPELREAARLPGLPDVIPDCGAFADALRSVTPDRWRLLAAGAQDRSDLRRDLEREVEAVARLQAEQAEDTEADDLAARLAPFSLDTPEEVLRGRVAACRDAEAELRGLEDRIRDLPDDKARSERRREAAEAARDALERLFDGWCGAPAPTDGDIRSWLERLRDEEREARRFWGREEARQQAETGLRESAGAASREEIERRRGEESAALGSIVREQEELAGRDALLGMLARIEDPSEQARALQTELDGERKRLQEARDGQRAAQEAEIGLHRRLATLEGQAAPRNLAQLELAHRSIEQRLQRLRRDRDALSLAFRWVREAADRYQGAHREDLELRITERFRNLTGRDGRSVRLDERFQLDVAEADGARLAPEQLSQGALDQLALATRLAAADLLADAAPLPIFLDDPFVHFDAERLGRMRESLARLSRSRQWILLTHRADLAAWAEPIEITS